MAASLQNTHRKLRRLYTRLGRTKNPPPEILRCPDPDRSGSVIQPPAQQPNKFWCGKHLQNHGKDLGTDPVMPATVRALWFCIPTAPFNLLPYWHTCSINIPAWLATQAPAHPAAIIGALQCQNSFPKLG